MDQFRTAIALLVSLGILTGCEATRGRKEVRESGFLGDYSQLQPKPDFPGQKIYLNPRADWARYDSIELDSVTLWVNEETAGLSKEEAQMLTDLLFGALHDKLDTHFKLTDRPDSNTIQVRFALTQARGANVPVRAISTMVPQTLMIGAAVGASADTAATVGSAAGEVELLDAVTHERLAAGVDSRAGTKDLTSGRTFETWGDVQAAARFWAGRIAQTMIRLGVQRKPGLPSLDHP